MGNRKIPSTVLLGSILLLVIILLVIAAPLFTSYAPDEAIAERLQEFSFSHPFGTDRYSRARIRQSQVMILNLIRCLFLTIRIRKCSRTSVSPRSKTR